MPIMVRSGPGKSFAAINENVAKLEAKKRINLAISKRGGGKHNYYISQDGLLKNSIDGGILAPGIYMNAKQNHSDSIISKSIHKSSIRPYTARRKSNKKHTARLRQSGGSIETNIPNYSDLQKTSFYNEIITSSTGGKINLLYAHYIIYIPDNEHKKQLLDLLLHIPLSNPETIKTIIKYFTTRNINGLIEYLKKEGVTHLNEVSKQLGKPLNKNTNTSINKLINEYISSDDSRYRIMLTYFENLVYN